MVQATAAPGRGAGPGRARSAWLASARNRPRRGPNPARSGRGGRRRPRAGSLGGRRGSGRVDLDATTPPSRAVPGVDEVQPVLGTGHADVRQAALLLELALVVEGPGNRQQPLLQPDHEHDGKLRPFAACSVIKVTRSGRSSRVSVRDERHFLEEAGEALGRGNLVELRRVVSQLDQVRPALRPLLGPVLQHGPQPASLEGRSRTDEAGSAAAIAARLRTSSAKPASDVRARVARLAFDSAASTATHRVLPRASAQARSSDTVLSPMPRVGT